MGDVPIQLPMDPNWANYLRLLETMRARLGDSKGLQHVIFAKSDEDPVAEFPSKAELSRWIGTASNQPTGLWSYHPEDCESKTSGKHLHWVHVCPADESGRCRCRFRRRLREQFKLSTTCWPKPGTDGYIRNAVAYLQKGSREQMGWYDGWTGTMEELPKVRYKSLLKDGPTEDYPTNGRNVQTEITVGEGYSTSADGSGEGTSREAVQNQKRSPATKGQWQKETTLLLVDFIYRYLPLEKAFLLIHPESRAILGNLLYRPYLANELVNSAWLEVQYKWNRALFKDIIATVEKFDKVFNYIYPLNYKIQFYSREYSYYVALALLRYQYHSSDEVINFLANLLEWVDGTDKKRNTICIYGQASSGKSYFFNSLVRVLWNKGSLGNVNKYSQDLFAFEDCYERRVIEWNECNVDVGNLQRYLELMEGKPYRTKVKYKDQLTIYQTPLLITTNSTPWNLYGDLKKPFLDRLKLHTAWTQAPWLKYLKLELNPLLWVDIYNKSWETIVRDVDKLPFSLKQFEDNYTDTLVLPSMCGSDRIINKYISD